MKHIKISHLKKYFLFLKLQWSEAVITLLLKLSCISGPSLKTQHEVSVLQFSA